MNKKSGTVETDFTKEEKANDPSAMIIAVGVLGGTVLAVWLDMWYPPLKGAIQSFFGI